MAGRATLVSITVIAAVWAGCVSSEVAEPNVSFEVTKASAVEGGCRGSTEEFCHTFEVHVKNDSEDDEVSMTRFLWDAETADGERFDSSHQDGPDAIAASREGTVQLQYSITSAKPLKTLVYEAWWLMEPIRIDIPNYDVEPWDPLLTLTVMNASGSGGSCVYNEEGWYCHSITVQVENNNEESASMDIYYWDAENASGDGVQIRDRRSSIRAGSIGELTLQFETETDEPLAVLTYADDWMLKPITVEIPEYEVAPWHPMVTLSVENVEVENGGCDSGDDRDCHKVTVRVVNDHPEERIEVRSYYWAGYVGGSSYDPERTDGPTSIGPGSEDQLMLEFELRDGKKLTQIEYVGRHQTFTVAIPEY